MILDTRLYVLEKALTVEKGVNDILELFLNVEKQKKKAFTNKSGGLSFKNKIDLLFDIEIFDDKEYTTILLLMEYRNQFMHNYDCNTFVDAFEFLGLDKKNRLLNYTDKKSDDKNEQNLKNAFQNLFYEILKILLEKTKLKKSNVAENKEYFDRLNNKVILLYDKYFELADLIFEFIEPNYEESKEISDYKISFFNTIKKSIEQNINSIDFNTDDFDKSEEYKIKMIGRLLNKRR